MNNILEILIIAVNTIFDHADTLLSSILNAGFLPWAEAGAVLTLAAAGLIVSEGVLANIRKWHGGIDDQFACINNLTNILQANLDIWNVPELMVTRLMDSRDSLQALINKCRTTEASTSDRNQRNSLLKSTVGYCLLQVKTMAYGLYSAGTITADDLHKLGFLLPGERGGVHVRSVETDVTAEVKVTIISSDHIRVVIDQSAGENAAQVAHGWPESIRYALIVIISADDNREIYRHTTTRLHNDIQMPADSRGKLFIIKASFLKHIDDEPRFGNEPTFSMPLTTEDLAAAIDRHNHEDFEAQMHEVERQRLEIERLQAELNARK
ncbi:MAG: hypothetical protein LBJ01_03165 [Tannerella sp.]|jgi:hypothetical protein|nr:hypothetical protein [Tannerella sp.]